MIKDEESRQAVTEVMQTLSRLSAAWRERRYENLTQFFAHDMVFTFPGFGGRLEGVSAIIASYREFMDRVTLTAYVEATPAVDVWGETAVASFGWEMAWLVGDVPNHERGHDVFVFRREAPGAPWRAVWRTMTFEVPGEKPPAPTA
jgi:hypothetical protein